MMNPKGRIGHTDDLAALRGQVITLRDACEALMVYVENTGWGDLALAGTGDKETDDATTDTKDQEPHHE